MSSSRRKIIVTRNAMRGQALHEEGGHDTERRARVFAGPMTSRRSRTASHENDRDGGDDHRLA